MSGKSRTSFRKLPVRVTPNFKCVNSTANDKRVTMDYRLEDAVPVLRRTPFVMRELLSGLPECWIDKNEGPKTWSPFDVVGHLIHGERTDWIPRVEHLLR